MPAETPTDSGSGVHSYIPPGAHMRECTPRAIILGAILGVIFGASSLYLVLKVGITVSASIPVAVISLALFRVWANFDTVLSSTLDRILSLLPAVAAFLVVRLFRPFPSAEFVAAVVVLLVSLFWWKQARTLLLIVTFASFVVIQWLNPIPWIVFVSIPIGLLLLFVMSKLVRTLLRHDATILENNIVQTAGSAGESIAFGLGVTMPAIMILGFDLEITRVMLVALLGGLLGILMMIPLRRALIVQQHAELKYPEGTACAEVLKAGANAESRAMASEAAQREAATLHRARGESAPSARAIFTGFGIGLLYKTAMSAFKLWKDTPEKIFGAPLAGGSISAEISPELLGVGYIIGPKISCIMAAGGVLSYLVLIPMIKFFGEGMTGVLSPGSVPIKDMDPSGIRSAYILYIGAGAVAAGGIISLLRSGPTILRGIRAGLSDFGAAAANARTNLLRTDRDLSMKFVLGGSVALVLAILFAPSLHMNILGAILIVVFGFLFVTVSSRLTGEIGSSSNPISGMTVATLLLTCLIFLFIGWTGPSYYVTALSVGGIVCIAASNGGSTSQDLKTGYLLGATPRYQQIAILIGAAASALALGPILLRLNTAGTVYVPAAQVAAGLHAPADATLGATEKITGPQAGQDSAAYRVWQKTDDVDGQQGRYLVDDSRAAVWFVSPGINPIFKKRPDGTEAVTFSAPKAVLMSYIIKGILNAKLPWALVLFGVMTSIVLELCGISSLAFAVGVYLPLSSSSPLLIGGFVRWLVDLRMRSKLKEHKLSEEQLNAESDKSSGVLLASGYIAGGAIAGIIIAFMAGALTKVDDNMTKWAKANNPFFDGPRADWLALIPFVLLAAFLYLVGREMFPANKSKPSPASERG